MTLADLQQAFLGDLAASDKEDAIPSSVAPGEGFAIYRNAYRTTLIDALKETFPRTLAYAGDDPFQAAAAHHLIQNPPASWSLDHLGSGFAETLAGLFAHNREVADLAALEWAMHEIFVSADTSPLSPQEFAQKTQAFCEDDWEHLELSLVPFATVTVSHDVLAWWRTPDAAPAVLPTSRTAIVWREEEQPVFIMVEHREAQALEMVRGGMNFGELCGHFAGEVADEDIAPVVAGYLQAWLQRGWIQAVSAKA